MAAADDLDAPFFFLLLLLALSLSLSLFSRALFSNFPLTEVHEHGAGHVAAAGRLVEVAAGGGVGGVFYF